MELNSEELKLEKLLRKVNLVSPSQERVTKIFKEFDKINVSRNYDLIFFRVILAIVIICFSGLFSIFLFAKRSLKFNPVDLANNTFGDINNTFTILLKSISSMLGELFISSNQHILIILSFFIVYLILREFDIIQSEL